MTYNLELNFYYGRRKIMYESWEIKITVPNDISITEIKKIILDAYNSLDEEEKDKICGNDNINPIEFLNDVCENHGWKWKEFSFDDELSFC